MSVVTQRQARPGRWQELLLLVVVFVIVLGAWSLVTAGVSDPESATLIPANLPQGAAIFGAVLLVGHLLIRWQAPWADPVLFPSAALLTGLGLVMIHRIDFALVRAGNSPEVGGQLVLAGLGVVLMILTLVMIRDHRILRRYTYISLIAGIILLLLPLVPGLGRTINGARLWINIAGFSFQPAELAKIAFAIFFAGYLVTQRDNLALAGKKVLGLQLPRLRHILPLLTAWVACMMILVLERDFGTAILFFGLFVAMLYVATERVSWLIIGGVLTVAGVFVIVKAMPHIQARFDIWLNALDPALIDAPYGSYQLAQGWFGMASGGLFGTGWGEGYPTMSYAANSDFIIASFGEELGLAGLLALLAIYLIFVSRAFNAGLHLRDGFGKLLASGLGFVIALQCFVVVGGVTRVIPLTGLAMPFLALGGSALLTNWIIVGLLIRMSDAARRPYRPSSTPLSQLDSGELPESLRSDGPPPSATTADDDVHAPFDEEDDAEPWSPDDEDGSDDQKTEVVRL